MPHPESRAPWSDVLRWLIVVPVSAGIGYVLDDLGVHAAWIVAGILASGAMALVSRRELRLNSAVERAARGVIGVLAGLSLVGVDYGSMLHFIVPGIVVALVTVGIGVGSGVLLSRHEKEVSVETGILGMLPGGSSTLPVIARDTGADYRLVALSQYLRLLIVSLTLPVVGGLTFGRPLDLSGHAANPQLAPTLALIAIALIVPYIGKALHFPAPHIFAPLLITPLAALAFHDPSSIVLPEPVRIVALLTIGWMCGGGLSTRSLKLFGKQLPLTDHRLHRLHHPRVCRVGVGAHAGHGLDLLRGLPGDQPRRAGDGPRARLRGRGRPHRGQPADHPAHHPAHHRGLPAHDHRGHAPFRPLATPLPDPHP